MPPREVPILMSAPMVRALLAGRKTQTRRTIKVQPPFQPMPYTDDRGSDWFCEGSQWCQVCPYGVPGDVLRARETYAFDGGWDCAKPSVVPKGTRVHFMADGPKPDWAGITRPAIFLPTWASRIRMRVTGVRVERLHAISEEDAKAEGAVFHDGHGVGHSGWRHDPDAGFVYPTARDSFAALWASINGEESLKSNPWVWCVSFERTNPPTTEEGHND